MPKIVKCKKCNKKIAKRESMNKAKIKIQALMLIKNKKMNK